MTRKEAEEAIMEKLKEIREIALEYSPERQHVGLYFIGTHLSFQNYAKRDEADGVLDCFEDISDGKGIYSFEHGGVSNAED